MNVMQESNVSEHGCPLSVRVELPACHRSSACLRPRTFECVGARAVKAHINLEADEVRLRWHACVRAPGAPAGWAAAAALLRAAAAAPATALASLRASTALVESARAFAAAYEPAKSASTVWIAQRSLPVLLTNRAARLGGSAPRARPGAPVLIGIRQVGG